METADLWQKQGLNIVGEHFVSISPDISVTIFCLLMSLAMSILSGYGN